MTNWASLLNSSFHRDSFDCGVDTLNKYLRHQAVQDIRKKQTACFVFYDHITYLVKGYYTLSTTELEDQLYVIRMDRLAVDLRFRKQGVGKQLLLDAVLRILALPERDSYAGLVVDPVDQRAKKYFEKFAFRSLPDSGKMYLTMNTMKQLQDNWA